MRMIKNVPTDKLKQVFEDLKYEGFQNVWATYEENQFWTIHYMPV